ncbi:hypothetical protein Ancab_028061 [Ancistrocladus abbreviatus]
MTVEVNSIRPWRYSRGQQESYQNSLLLSFIWEKQSCFCMIQIYGVEDRVCKEGALFVAVWGAVYRLAFCLLF